MGRVFLVACCVWLWSASSASADVAAVMAVGGSPELDAAQWDAAGVSAAMELERRGYALPVGAVRTRANSPQDCVAETCLQAERARLGVDLLAVVSVFSSIDVAEHAGSVVVTLIDPSGSYVGRVELGHDALDIAIRRAVLAATELLARGGQPWLSIRGTPPGALIVIDGVETGVLPWQGPVGAGEHRVEVSLGRYEPFSEIVAVQPGAPRVLEVALRTGARRVRAWYSIAGPVALGIGGLALIVVDAAGLADTGCSVAGASGGPCLRGRGIDEVPFGVVGALGIAAIVGAAVWLALGEEDAPVQAQLGVGSVGLRGSF